VLSPRFAAAMAAAAAARAGACDTSTKSGSFAALVDVEKVFSTEACRVRSRVCDPSSGLAIAVGLG
jgi:hypothetical protein